ncbi:hypothetical protein ACJX0J_025936, partial [Zea mays]
MFNLDQPKVAAIASIFIYSIFTPNLSGSALSIFVVYSIFTPNSTVELLVYVSIPSLFVDVS